MITRFKVLLLLNLAFCGVGAATKRFPAWRMFERMEAFELHLEGSLGQPLYINSYLPGDAYPTNLRMLKPVLAFICRKEGSLKVEEKVRGLSFTLSSPECEAHAF